MTTPPGTAHDPGARGPLLAGGPGSAAPLIADSFDTRFSRLFAERFGPLFAYLNRLTGDADFASDLAQDAFLKLYRRGGFPDDIGAWLVTVAHNRLRDQQRSMRRRLRILAGHADRVPAPVPMPEAHAGLVAEERRERVRRVLSRMGERERKLLLLHHGGYSYREIGIVLAVAESGVGTLLRRAGVAFRLAFEDTYGAPD